MLLYILRLQIFVKKILEVAIRIEAMSKAFAGRAGKSQKSLLVSKNRTFSHLPTKDQSAGRLKISARVCNRAESAALLVKPALFSSEGARLLSFPTSF